MRDKVRDDARNRLARIQGQVAGLQRMIDEERYCVDVLTQVSALRSALDQFGLLMLTTHLESCVYGENGEKEGSKWSPEERADEIRLTLNRFLK